MRNHVNYGPVAGHSTTVTRYLGASLRKQTPRKVYLTSSANIAAHASNGWIFDVQCAGTSILTSTGTWDTLSGGDGALTAGTPVALTPDMTKVVTLGGAMTLVMTIQASGVDQSSTNFTIDIEYED